MRHTYKIRLEYGEYETVEALTMTADAATPYAALASAMQRAADDFGITTEPESITITEPFPFG